MLKTILALMCMALLLPVGTALATRGVQAGAPVGPAQLANEIVAAVNNLREQNGLSPINPHPILMQLAQGQAAYMAATGQITHLSADGKRPFQRALAAGYPVAGDLSLGGFYSENIQAGPIVSAQEVVNMWLGDDLHTNTMLSPNRSDIGAGVAFVGDEAFYVIDTALASSRPVQYTPEAGEDLTGAENYSYSVAPAATSTPMPDGSILHTVGYGETLWGIAASYGTTVEQIAMLNRTASKRFIQPGEEFLIRPAYTATPPEYEAYSPKMTATPTLQPVAMVAQEAKPGSTQGRYGIFGRLTVPLGYLILAVALALGIALAVQYYKESRPKK